MNKATADDIVKTVAARTAPADMPTDVLQWAADLIGVEPVLRLILELSGFPIYISKSVRTSLLKQYARSAFDGSNARKLARKLCLSERAIRDWTRDLLNSPGKATSTKGRE